MTLREQIEALDIEEVSHAGWDRAGVLHLSVGLGGEIMVSRAAVLDIIDAHRCIPDRDRLARALPDVMSQEVCDAVMGRGHDPLDLTEEWYMTPRELADNIIAALEKTDAKD